MNEGWTESEKEKGKAEKERETGLTGVPGLLMRPWDAPQFTITTTTRECCASLCGTYRGAGAFESRSYRGGDLRLARELHGGSDRGTNHAIGRWRRDRHEHHLGLPNSLPCARRPFPQTPGTRPGPPRCGRTTLLFVLRSDDNKCHRGVLMRPLFSSLNN